MGIIHKVSHGYRPQINDNVPDFFRDLIERCWSQEPENRPTFAQIVEEMKNSDGFIDDLIDESEFYDYVDYIDHCRSSFDTKNYLIHFDDFIKAHGRNKSAKKASISKDEEMSDEFESYEEEEEEEEKEEVKTQIDSLLNDIDSLEKWFEPVKLTHKIKEEEDNSKIIEEIDKSISFSIYEINSLSEACKKLVEEAENDPKKQFEVAVSLIEAKNDFQTNIALGKEYLKKSLKSKYPESIIFYIRNLIKGKIIQQDLHKAKRILRENQQIDEKNKIVLKALIYKANKKYSKAVKYFEKGIKLNDLESMYEYGKLLFIGQGIKKNDNKAFEYFNLSSKKGFQKSSNLLTLFKYMKQFKEFQRLKPIVQLFFVKRCIPNIFDKQSINQKQMQDVFENIIISSNKTEMLFYSRALKSADFHTLLSKFKSILIEMHYQSQSFKKILDLTTKIKIKKVKQMKIMIVLSNLSDKISKEINFLKVSQVIVDSTITVIPSKIIGKCTSLAQIIIPSSVTSIKEYAFCQCTNLREFIIPNSVTSIKNSTFSGCSSLTKITIPPSVTSIEHNAFENCTSLDQIKIPSSVKSIDYCAFYCCSSLRQISIPFSVVSIKSGICTCCSSLTQVTIPTSVTEIRSEAFKECTSLQNISIPSLVMMIGERAFYKCSSLKQITIPSSVKYICLAAFYDCVSLTRVSIPSSITVINDFVFSGCSSLNKVKLYSSITCIGRNAFSRCSSLTKFVIPSSVTSIGNCAFGGCSSLAQITIPSSVTSIGDCAFGDCSSLRQITIPSSVISIGEGAFNGCSLMNQIVVPSCFSNIKELKKKRYPSLPKAPTRFYSKTNKNSNVKRRSSLPLISIPSILSSLGLGKFSARSRVIKI